MADLHQETAVAQTAYFVRLRGKNYTSGETPTTALTAHGDAIGVFVGPNARQAQGAFAIVCARCELPTVNPDTEMRLFDVVLKELDNAGA